MSRPKLVKLLASLGLLAAVAYLLVGIGRSRLVRFAIRGDSMAPTLNEGDFVTVLRIAKPSDLKSGALVVVRDPRSGDSEMVKRVTASLPNGDLVVLGDNPAGSTDSRQFGPVPRELLVGRVVLRYWPPARFKVFA